MWCPERLGLSTLYHKYAIRVQVYGILYNHIGMCVVASAKAGAGAILNGNGHNLHIKRFGQMYLMDT